MNKEGLKILDSVDHYSFQGHVQAVVDHTVLKYCKCPYYKHPLGCPNWGIKEGCPPNLPLFTSIYLPEVVLVAAGINFAEYLKIRRKIHPNWTERQLRNLRHWQGHVNMLLRNKLTLAKMDYPERSIVMNSEALGVNVFATCKNAGLILEKYPQKRVYKVALLAIKK